MKKALTTFFSSQLYFTDISKKTIVFQDSRGGGRIFQERGSKISGGGGVGGSKSYRSLYNL